jgi:2-methylcitrate dehydratase
MVVAHYIPFRAIRHGHQLSDSKGASAAISTEAAILSMKRSMAGFVGPKDIFRNPEAIFNLFTTRLGGSGIDAKMLAEMKQAKRSPFDLVLSRAGSDFTVMGMHFKLGLYEHQSAGALQGLIDLLRKAPGLLDDPRGGRIASMTVRAYEPAFGIIGDPAKRDPHTRQSADHSMLYLVCTMLRKAVELRASGKAFLEDNELAWKALMLGPYDFDHKAINNALTRSLMERMRFEHGGPEYDARYPDGIPTSLVINDAKGEVHDSGLVMYPSGHARNRTANLRDILSHKWTMLGGLATNDPSVLILRLSTLGSKTPLELAEMYHFHVAQRERID